MNDQHSINTAAQGAGPGGPPSTSRPLPEATLDDARGAWCSWASGFGSVLSLVLAVTLVRLVYLAFLCPYTLIEDEAHYWEWSRRLDLSYYTKGPGIAWTIAAGTSVGGDTAFGVRLASPIASAVLCLSVAALARSISRDGRVAFFAVCALLLAPVFQIMGLMLTIDGPYAACWALAAALGWIALSNRSGAARLAWLAMGLVIGVGFLYKYTILLMLPGLAVAWLLLRPMTRDASDDRDSAAQPADARRAGESALASAAWPFVVGGVVLMFLAISPVLIWNMREGWPTVRHLLGHLGVAGGDMPVADGSAAHPKDRYSPLWTLTLIGTQIALVGPSILLIIPSVLNAWRARLSSALAMRWWRGVVYCVSLGLPVLLFYLGVSFVAEPEGNWPIAGWITMLPLIGHAVVAGWPKWRERVQRWSTLPEPRPRHGLLTRRPETFTQVVWTWSIIVGVLVAVVSPRLDAIAWAAGLVPGGGRIIPIHRFSGADVMGRDAQRLFDQLAAESGQAPRAPFIMAMHYGRASQLAFYMPSRPIVVCASSAMLDGRVTQYDYWPDTRPKDRDDLLGANALVVGATQAAWERVFDRVVLIGRLEGDGKRDRPAFFAYGFRGFPPGGIPRDSLPPDPPTPPKTPPDAAQEPPPSR